MSDVDKVAFAVGWYEARWCPGCRSTLEDVAGIGDGHTLDGVPFTGGHHPKACVWTADQLAALCHIGSGMVKYHPSSGGTNRPPLGDDGSPRETAPTRLLR